MLNCSIIKGALASAPISPFFCTPSSHVIEVTDMRMHFYIQLLIRCGVKAQWQGRFLSHCFRRAFWEALIIAEDAITDGFFESISAIHQLFKRISDKIIKKKHKTSSWELDYFKDFNSLMHLLWGFF